MELSYWEYKSWLANIDFTIVGSGIVGLSTAIFLKESNPKAKIVILEKGILPQGASTKNAGFACFGSISEIISDLKTHTVEQVIDLVDQRYQGIQLLRKLIGDKALGFQIKGGHELFLDTQTAMREVCFSKLDEVNQIMTPVFGDMPFQSTSNRFNFEGIYHHYITHKFEGQLDTGMMMTELLNKVKKLGIQILNTIEVTDFIEAKGGVAIKTNKFELNTSKLFIATNGFASSLLDVEVKPARAQVLVTKKIENLKIQGTFHLDEGYYYFRNIDNRILLGGGRNLDLKTEETTEFGMTALIQNELERLLENVILPQHKVEIERRWSGIMGVGNQKRPIVKQLSDTIFCGVRLGGMGVAIGSMVGKRLASML